MVDTDGLYVPKLASVSTRGTPSLSFRRTWQSGGEPPRDSQNTDRLSRALSVLSCSLHRNGCRIASQLRNEHLREDLWTFQDHFDIEVDSCHLC